MFRRRSSARRTALAVGLAIWVSVAAVGCSGGGPEPSPKDWSKDDNNASEAKQEKDSPSPTPSPTGPEAEPYVQVALDYYEAHNEAIKTGDAERLRQLSTSTCEACRGTADSIEEIYANGGRIEGGEIDPVPDIEIKATGDENRGAARVTVVNRWAAEVLVEQAGADPQEFPVELKEETFTLTLKGEQWLITKLTEHEYKR